MFVGGDVVRPHLLTTAIGHGAIAADGIDRHLRSEALDKRPKIDVHSFDLTRKMVEKGLKITRIDEPLRGTDASTGAIHNYDNRSDRYVIPHDGAVPRPLQLHAAQPAQDRHARPPSRRWATSRSACCRCSRRRRRPRPSAA